AETFGYASKTETLCEFRYEKMLQQRWPKWLTGLHPMFLSTCLRGNVPLSLAAPLMLTNKGGDPHGSEVSGGLLSTVKFSNQKNLELTSSGRFRLRSFHSWHDAYID
ncbi:hypothetical protein RMSM_03463, partial [Rhodopirellula maiorica SM1]